jgi:predicted DNA-binding transcriptional regulator YafY
MTKATPNALSLTLDILERTKHRAMTTQALAAELGVSHQTLYLYVNALARRGVLEPFNGPRRTRVRKGNVPRFWRLAIKWGGEVRPPALRLVHALIA